MPNTNIRLQGDDPTEVYAWSPKLVAALQESKILDDVNSDQQQKGLESDVIIDRDTASRLGITPEQIDNTLYDAFGQRQVSTIYSAINQYHVVMEVAPRYWQRPEDAQGHLCQHRRRPAKRNADQRPAGRHGRGEHRPSVRNHPQTRRSTNATAVAQYGAQRQ